MALESAISARDEPFEFDRHLKEKQTLLMKNIFGIQQRKDAFTRVSNSRRHQMISVSQFLRLPHARKTW